MHPGTDLSDRYRLRRRLAAGGMGEVWLADDLVLGREVAVKVLAVGSDAPASAVERFDREARTLALLQHPNVVGVLDSGARTGTAFMVMELLAGPTLAQLLSERGRLPEAEAVRLATQVAAGLADAHRAGVIHRDIKPSNLMFSSSGALKILDFGIARLSQTTAAGLTATDAVIGSAPYLSPEQAAGKPADERSDLYALGCVLMAMVAGRPPFTADHPMAVLHQQIHAEPPVLRQLHPAASPALEALVARLLSKDPEARPATAGEVEAQLIEIAAALPGDGSGTTATLALPPGGEPPATAMTAPAATRVYPAGAGVPDPAVADLRDPAAAAPQGIGPAPAGRRRLRPAWLIAAGVVLVAVLAGLALTFLPDRSPEETAAAPTPSSALPTPAATTSPSQGSATPAESTAAPSATAAPPVPLEAVRAAVDAVIADGQLDPKRTGDVTRRLDDLARKLEEGDKGLDKQVENFSKYLGGLVKKGDLTEDGFRRIQAALDQL